MSYSNYINRFKNYIFSSRFSLFFLLLNIILSPVIFLNNCEVPIIFFYIKKLSSIFTFIISFYLLKQYIDFYSPFSWLSINLEIFIMFRFWILFYTIFYRFKKFHLKVIKSSSDYTLYNNYIGIRRNGFPSGNSITFVFCT